MKDFKVVLRFTPSGVQARCVKTKKTEKVVDKRREKK